MEMICPHCGIILLNSSTPSCTACRKKRGETFWDQIKPPAKLEETNKPTTPVFQPPPLTPEQEKMKEFQGQLKELSPRVIVTPIVMVAIWVVYLAMGISGVSFTKPTNTDLLKWGADYGPLTLNGQWWRMLTATFVHIGFSHILLNFLCLGGASSLVERMVGSVGFLALYLISGLCGSLASLFWNPLGISAGASGAVFGVYGALLGLILPNRNTIPQEVFKSLRSSGVYFIIINILFGFFMPNVDIAAHFGGCVAGFCCGLILSHPLSEDGVRGRKLRNQFCIGFGFCLVIVGWFALESLFGNLNGAPLNPARVTRDKILVLYGNGVSENEAEKAAEFLNKVWAPVTEKIAISLTQNEEVYFVGFTPNPEEANKPETLIGLQFLAARMSRDVFQGKGVEIQFMQYPWTVLKKIPLPPDIRNGLVLNHVELFYSDGIRKTQAQRVAKLLSEIIPKTDGKPNEPISIKLNLVDGIYQISLIMEKDKLKNPENRTVLKQEFNSMKNALFPDSKVHFVLCDSLFQPHEVIKLEN